MRVSSDGTPQDTGHGSSDGNRPPSRSPYDVPMPTVERFNLTPVKSTALLHPDAIDLRPEGAVGDRRFLFVRANGERLSGVTKAPLMHVRSTYDVAAEHLTLT